MYPSFVLIICTQHAQNHISVCKYKHYYMYLVKEAASEKLVVRQSHLHVLFVLSFFCLLALLMYMLNVTTLFFFMFLSLSVFSVTLF